jgi:hypothetical protein
MPWTVLHEPTIAPELPFRLNRKGNSSFYVSRYRPLQAFASSQERAHPDVTTRSTNVPSI